MADRDWTVCPRCAVGCHLARGADRAAGRTGPSNPAGRLCQAGIAAFDGLDENRLVGPLVRRDGDLEATSWATALADAAEGFAAIRDRHGPDALAFLGAPHATTEANYRLQKLARCLGTNNVDNRARHCHDETARTLAARLGWPATTNSLADLPDADVILVVGANPARRQPVAFNAFVRPAVADGTTLVHIDPVGTETTRLADVHVSPRPGRDAAVLDCLSAGLAERDGPDLPFLAERTRGAEAFLADLAALDVAETAALAGVDVAAVERVAELLADADRVAAVVGTGIEGGVGSAPDALVNLVLLSGNVGRRGTGIHLFRGLVNEQGAVDAGCAPDRLPGHRPVTDETVRRRLGDVWGIDPPAAPGRSAQECLAAFGDSVRGALVVGENPGVSKRDPDWLTDRLDALATLVVVDIAPGETTAQADVVLPAAAGVEVTGSVTNLDRQVQRLTPVASPPGSARPDRVILGALGRRLVGEDAFPERTPAEVFDELAAVSPAYDGLDWDSLGDGTRWPDGVGVLYRDSFATPDGRAPLGGVQPFPEPDETAGLRLVVGGRVADGTERKRTLRLHSEDAAARGVTDGDRVVVTGGGHTVEAAARVTADGRRGTVSLHAAAADPFVRRGVEVVAVEAVAER